MSFLRLNYYSKKVKIPDYIFTPPPLPPYKKTGRTCDGNRSSVPLLLPCS